MKSKTIKLRIGEDGDVKLDVSEPIMGISDFTITSLAKTNDEQRYLITARTALAIDGRIIAASTADIRKLEIKETIRKLTRALKEIADGIQ